ncbi:MAG: methyltransferase domain-containing protein [bacterium]
MFTSPEKNVLEFGFLPGQTVADFGSGSGHYSLALSKAVGPTGQIYAIDLRVDALTMLKGLVEKEGRNNLEVLVGDIDNQNGSGLKTEIVDGVVLSNILFQLGNVEQAVTEAKRVTKPGGKICLVEWSSKFPEARAKQLFEKAGLTFIKKFDAGDSHYGFVFKK